MIDTDDGDYDPDYEHNTYYKFEEKFNNGINLFTLPDGDSIMRAVVSVKAEAENTDNITKDAEDNNQIETKGDLLLGKMSFQMQGDTFDISQFALVEANTSPKTGIRIELDGEARTDITTMTTNQHLDLQIKQHQIF